MRKKPFSRQRMLKGAAATANGKSNMMSMDSTASMASNNNNNLSKAINNNLIVGQQNRERLTDGLNSITRSIMQTRVSGLDQGLEQHQDDVPLRPLLLNGSTAHLNSAQTASVPADKGHR